MKEEPAEASAVPAAPPRPSRAWPRHAARAGVVTTDVVSGIISTLPLSLIYLAIAHIWVTTTGRYSDLLDEWSVPAVLVISIFSFTLTLLPAILGNVLLGERTGWSVRMRLGLAGILVPLPFVVALAWPAFGTLVMGWF